MITKGNQAAHQMDPETYQLIHHNGANRKQYARIWIWYTNQCTSIYNKIL